MIVSEEKAYDIAKMLSEGTCPEFYISLFPFCLLLLSLLVLGPLIRDTNFIRQQAQRMERINNMGTTPQRLAPQPLRQRR